MPLQRFRDSITLIILFVILLLIIIIAIDDVKRRVIRKTFNTTYSVKVLLLYSEVTKNRAARADFNTIC